MQVNTCIPGFFFGSLCFSDFSGINLRPGGDAPLGLGFCHAQ